MKIICRLLLAMACLCLANISWATVCANSTGVAEDEHYDLSNIFNSTNNQPGQIVVLPEKSGWVGVSAICPPGTLVNYTYRSYVTNFIVQETIDNYKYMQLNDYLLGAMSLVDSVMDIQFPPQNYIRMGTDPNVSQNLPFGVMDSRLIFRLKVIRPFINMVEIPRQVMFTVYVTSTPYDPLVTPVYTISFGGRVEALVPVGAQHRYAVLCPPQVDEPPGTLPGAGPAADALLLVHLGAAQVIDLHSAEPAGLHAGPAGHAAIGAEQAAAFIPLGPAAAAAMDRRRPGREFPLDCHGFSPSFLLICPISIPQITPLAKREPAIPAPTLPPTKKICAGGLTGEGKLHIISIRLENKLLLRR